MWRHATTLHKLQLGNKVSQNGIEENGKGLEGEGGMQILDTGRWRVVVPACPFV